MGLFKITCHGVVKGDAYLKASGVGAGRGRPATQGENTFTSFLKIKDLLQIVDLGSLAEVILKQRLGLSISALVKPEAKLTQSSDGVSRMLDLDQPLSFYVSEDSEEVPICLVSATLYLPAEQLARARAVVTARKWEDFKQEAASMAFGKRVSDNNWALLVGHGADTIKKALDSQTPTTSNTIGDIEKFMDTHRSDSFTSLAGLLAFKQMKKAKKNGTPISMP